MPEETGMRAVVRPQLDERSTDKEVSRLENKIDAATDANVDLGMADAEMAPGGGAGGAAAAAGGGRGGGLLGGAASGGLVRTALAGAVGFGLLKGIQSLAGEHAPMLQKKLDLVSEGIGLLAGAFGEKLAEYLPAEDFWNASKSFYETAMNQGLDVAVAGGLEGMGEFALESVSLDDLVESTTAEQLIGGTVGAAALIGAPMAAGALFQGGVAASSLITGGVAASTLITGSVAAGSLIAGTVAADQVIDKTTGGEGDLGEVASGAFSFLPGVEAPDKKRQQEIAAEGHGAFASTAESLGLPSGPLRNIQREKTNKAFTPISERDTSVTDPLPDAEVLGDAAGTNIGPTNQGDPQPTDEGGGGGDGADNDQVVSKLDEVKRELKNLDISFDEKSLSRSTNSAQKTFQSRRSRDNN